MDGGELQTVREFLGLTIESLAGMLRVRRDEDMHASRPDTAHLPARWWRHVVARAAHEVPGVEIVTWRG